MTVTMTAKTAAEYAARRWAVPRPSLKVPRSATGRGGSPKFRKLLLPELRRPALAGAGSVLLQLSELHPADLPRDRLGQVCDRDPPHPLVRRQPLAHELEERERR